MDDEFLRFKNDLAQLQRSFPGIDGGSRQVYLDFIANINQTVKSFTMTQSVFDDHIPKGTNRAYADECVRITQEWRESLNLNYNSRYKIDDVTSIHKSWFEKNQPIIESLQPLRIEAKSKLVLLESSQQLIETTQFIAGLRSGVLKPGLEFMAPRFLNVEKSIGNVINTYRQLTDSLQNIADIVRLPMYILPNATHELHLTINVYEAVRSGMEQVEKEPADFQSEFFIVTEQEEADCVSLLGQIDPKYVVILQGARDALCSNNADKKRHVLISLRELLSDLLRTLAPDEFVLSWIDKQTKQGDLIHDNKPTRRARFLYVCRNLNNSPLAKFIEKDTSTFLELFKLFQDIHKKEISLTDELLELVLYRSYSYIIFILKIASET